MSQTAFFLLGAMTLSVVLAAPTGAPSQACDTDLYPQHYNVAGDPSSGVAPGQTSPPPYTLTAASISGGYRLTLTATSGTFRGFFIQARIGGVPDSDASRGFSVNDPNIQLRPCPGGASTPNGVTHTNSIDKTSIQVDWLGPTGTGVNFVATVVLDYATFWVRSLTVAPTPLA